jgi:hypothetical protein
MKKVPIKDFQEVEDIEETFFEGRECEYCNEPIADQVHATRKFCPKTKDSKGNVIDCKTDFHREKEAPDKLIQNDLINKHKGIAKRINDLLSKKSSEVLTANLDAYDIDLSSCIEFTLKSNGELTTIFLEHTIFTNPISKTHKILHNVK